MTNLPKLSIRRIVDSLHSAECAQDVYDALCYVPTENLKDMDDMIADILAARGSSNDY